jgi:hypothetical protein
MIGPRALGLDADAASRHVIATKNHPENAIPAMKEIAHV